MCSSEIFVLQISDKRHNVCSYYLKIPASVYACIQKYFFLLTTAFVIFLWKYHFYVWVLNCTLFLHVLHNNLKSYAKKMAMTVKISGHFQHSDNFGKWQFWPHAYPCFRASSFFVQFVNFPPQRVLLLEFFWKFPSIPVSSSFVARTRSSVSNFWGKFPAVRGLL